MILIKEYLNILPIGFGSVGGLFLTEPLVNAFKRGGLEDLSGKLSSISLILLGIFLITRKNEITTQTGIGFTGIGSIILLMDLLEDTKVMGEEEDNIILVGDSELIKSITQPEKL